MRSILVCETQVPFVRGGAELLVQQLVDQLRRRGFTTDKVSVPFQWHPKQEVLAHAAAWRLLNLSESNGQPVDLVIATKFPTYFARHPRKVCWLVHQHRAVYELADTRFSDYAHDELDVALRRQVMALDEQMLAECAGCYTISQTVTDRLARFNDISAPPLYHPPLLAPRLESGPYGSYVLSVSRLEDNKRVDLTVQAMAQAPPGLSLMVVGEGSQRRRIEQMAVTLGIGDRVQFAGAVSDDDLVTLYAGALAVAYVPFDEDYGLATLEGFLAARPVITATDSGGTLEFVTHDETGLVCDPSPEAIAAAMARLDADRALAARLGEAGRAVARQITWDAVIERLVSHG
ncbi:MAG: glycosyltransferase family 4 protein [Acidobacteria bacterium]|nr:glycosyltransferase family 4 protein [Acidobacteriota bacterium]